MGGTLLCAMCDSQDSPEQVVPWFVATEKFDKSDAGWAKYITWSGLDQLDEVVSLDCSLCPTVLSKIKAEYWNRIVNEDFMLNFFTDLEYLRIETASILRKNLLLFFEIHLLTRVLHRFLKGSSLSGMTLWKRSLA